MKKIVKKADVKLKNKKSDCPKSCVTTAHKIWGAIALAGLFACGLLLGLSYSVGNVGKNVGFDAAQCDAIANEIVAITKLGQNKDNAKNLQELNDAYSKGCLGRLVIIEHEKRMPLAKDEKTDIMATCSRIEKLLEHRLYPEDSLEYWVHLRNADTYSTMADKGCSENTEMYKALALRELEIATALQPEENMQMNDAEIVIDTFKKLDMQREAQAFLNKIEQLIDPATEFILKMEKIIDE